MEAGTQLAIALTSIVTSSFTVFLSNFLAPRINAFYEQRYHDARVLKKTLRILLEIETYVQRNLKLPSLAYYSESIIPKLTELGFMSGDQAKLMSGIFPQLIQIIQPQIAQSMPDNSEALEREFALVLTELSTVDPLLAYRISERHVISPIKKMDGFLIDSLKSLGLEIKPEDAEVQLLDQFAKSQKSEMIDELLSDLRTDILNVAARIGKETVKEIQDHFDELDLKRRKHAEKISCQVADLVHDNAKSRN